MKKTWLQLLLTIVIVSGCKKDTMPKLPDSEFSFLLDGKAYTFNGSLYADKGSVLQRQWFAPEYIFLGKASFDTWLQAKFPETQLKLMTYNVDLMMSLDGVRYDHSKNGQLTISTLNNDVASGTFSGEILTSPGSASRVISNGRFKDVLVKK